jgi:hypothetical protein
LVTSCRRVETIVLGFSPHGLHLEWSVHDSQPLESVAQGMLSSSPSLAPALRSSIKLRLHSRCKGLPRGLRRVSTGHFDPAEAVEHATPLFASYGASLAQFLPDHSA